jgi:hypothetical protein
MKKIVLLSAMCVFMTLPANKTMAQVASGTTGDCTWTLTGTSGNYTLTISGNGVMEDYSSSDAPWYSYRTDIKSLDIQQGVTIIGNWGFANCGLTSVSISNSVISIGDRSFAFCNDLTSISIPNSVKTIEGAAFAFCRGLTSVSIPNSVTSIGNMAFYGCDGLTSVIIPNSVIDIGDAAFSACDGLSSVVIPHSVIFIRDLAFAHCKSLTSITNLNPIPQNISSNVFLGVEKKKCTLKVAPSSVRSYKKATGWKDFSPIIGEQTNEK